MSLTNKQQMFIVEYLKDFNGARAARAAGYAEKNARITASQLLNKPGIQEVIRTEKDTRIMTADEVKTRLCDIARGDMADLMKITPSGFVFRLVIDDGEGNRIVNPKTKLIKRIKQKVTTRLSKTADGEDSETIETELELYSAAEALQAIGKMHALFTDKVDLDTLVRFSWDINTPSE